MILYDISLVGQARRLAWLRTGILRVVESGALELAALGVDEFTLCATTHKDFAGHRVFAREQGPPWSEIPLLHTDDARLNRAVDAHTRLYKGINLLTRVVDKVRPCAPPLRLVRRGLVLRSQALDTSLGTLSARDVERASLFHSPANAFPEVVLASRVPKIITVYDLTPIVCPQACVEAQGIWMQQVLDSARAGGWACAISEATKADLCEHAGLKPEQVFVTPLAADPTLFYPCHDEARLQKVRALYSIPAGPYLLSVCTLEPRKNLDHLVRAFANLVRAGEAEDLSLVLVGGKGWMADKIFEEIARAVHEPALRQKIRNRIIVTGFVPDADLAPLYSGALAFAYLSLYEGFGLPPLEAMACGVPVITSSTSSLPEVVGDAGVLLDPHDQDGLCQAILHLLHSERLRDEHRQRSLERAAQFSWQKFARDTLAAYQAVQQGS